MQQPPTPGEPEPTRNPVPPQPGQPTPPPETQRAARHRRALAAIPVPSRLPGQFRRWVRSCLSSFSGRSAAPADFGQAVAVDRARLDRQADHRGDASA